MNWNLLRDILLFTGGLAGVGYETLGQSTDRPTLLILFAAMMGLPAFLSGGAVQERAMRGNPNKPKRHLRWVEDPPTAPFDSPSSQVEQEPEHPALKGE
jgi:hypothetical protein